jgi:hypothetical protein
MLHENQHASSVTADRPALPRLQGTLPHFKEILLLEFIMNQSESQR